MSIKTSPLTPSTRLNRVDMGPHNQPSPGKKRVVKKSLARKLGSKSMARDIDDEFEPQDEPQEIKRHRSSLMTEWAHSFQSPQRVGEQPYRKLDQAGNSGMTNKELAQHYKDCIRQYTENKISMKNAFSLKLLDMLPDCIRLENNNFQSAGTALDASAKIYSYRVDVVHEDAFKIVGGLGRTAHKKRGADGEEGGSESNSPVKRKRKRRAARSVVDDVKSINMPSKDEHCEDDCLFRHACSQFDEGGLTGLLYNNVYSMGDGMPLLLHCMSHAETVHDPNAVKQVPPLFDDGDKKLLEQTKKILNYSNFLPSLAGFRFKNWSADSDEDDNEEFEDLVDPEQSKFRAQIEPEIEMNAVDDDLDGLEPEAPEEWPEPIAAAEKLGIALDQEYSYFDQTQIQGFKGPKHWKIKKEDKDKVPVKKKRQPAKRKKKDAEVLFDVEKELEKVLNIEKVPLMTNELNLARYEKESLNQLDAELDYKPESLFKLGNKTAQVSEMVKRIPEPMEIFGLETESADDDDDNPTADKQQFAPEASSVDQPTFAAGFDLTEYQPSTSPMPSSSPLPPINEEEELSSQPPTTSSLLTPSSKVELIPKPNSIPKIKINYATKLRRIDARAVKTAAWNILVDSKEKKAKLNNPDIHMAEKRNLKFSELWNGLPPMLKPGFKEDLRPADALNFLLHLANEKNLHLMGDASLGDITISQSTSDPQQRE